jgi:uncharacterized membrane protein
MMRAINIIDGVLFNVSGFVVGWNIANYFTHKPVNWLAVGLGLAISITIGVRNFYEGR